MAPRDDLDELLEEGRRGWRVRQGLEPAEDVWPPCRGRAVEWGRDRCEGCRFAPGELVYDETMLLCIGCGDLLWERQAAIALSPGLRALLPPVFER